MSATGVFELLAALAALAAAIFIFDQHLHRPRPHKLMWSLGLLFYGIAAFAAFLGSDGWMVAEYKAWYFFGGILTAAYLGLGTLYLLAPRRLAHVAAGIAVVLSLYAAARVLTYPVPPDVAASLASASFKQVTTVSTFHVLPDDIRPIAGIMNGFGTLFLFGGAVWSAWTFWRKHAPGYRLASMVFIALGAVLSAALTGVQALGQSSLAPLGELLGALCLLVGLLISLDVFIVFRVPFTGIVLRERRPAPAVSEGVAGPVQPR